MIVKKKRRDLQPGDVVFVHSGMSFTVTRVREAVRRKYVVIDYKNGERGGGHGDDLVEVIEKE